VLTSDKCHMLSHAAITNRSTSSLGSLICEHGSHMFAFAELTLEAAFLLRCISPAYVALCGNT
jgi:hypothetical protein